MTTIGRFTNLFKRTNKVQHIDLVTQNGAGFYLWGNTAYHSDLVRACVNARAKRFCKLSLKQIRESLDEDGHKTLAINPDANYGLMLEDPNPHMTMHDLLYKVSVQLDLSGNAFVLILRDDNGVPRSLYPIPARSVDSFFGTGTELFYDFLLKNGNSYRFAAADVIHLRADYYDSDLFGESKFKALKPLLEVVETTDRGVINAVRNSGIVKWLLKYTSALRPEDLSANAKKFADNYLNLSSDSLGVAAIDAKADAQQVTPTDYVPNAAQMDRTRDRILMLFNINLAIVTSTADEDDENAYYSACIEPDAVGMREEFTRKLFSARQRGCGNYIAVGSFNLQAASVKTKLALSGMVDRGALTPNQWLETLGLPPVQGGDVPLRRLDTAPVTEGGTEPPQKGGEN